MTSQKVCDRNGLVLKVCNCGGSEANEKGVANMEMAAVIGQNRQSIFDKGAVDFVAVSG
mgnify:CR=1 FL=1